MVATEISVAAGGPASSPSMLPLHRATSPGAICTALTHLAVQALRAPGAAVLRPLAGERAVVVAASGDVGAEIAPGRLVGARPSAGKRRAVTVWPGIAEGVEHASLVLVDAHEAPPSPPPWLELGAHLLAGHAAAPRLDLALVTTAWSHLARRLGHRLGNELNPIGLQLATLRLRMPDGERPRKIVGDIETAMHRIRSTLGELHRRHAEHDTGTVEMGELARRIALELAWSGPPATLAVHGGLLEEGADRRPVVVPETLVALVGILGHALGSSASRLIRLDSDPARPCMHLRIDPVSDVLPPAAVDVLELLVATLESARGRLEWSQHAGTLTVDFDLPAAPN